MLNYPVKALMRSEIQDSATCAVCAELDGIVLPADDPRWGGELGMPAHCNCRYDLIPLFEGIDPVMNATDADLIPELLQILGSVQTRAMVNAMRIPVTGANRFLIHQLTLTDIEDLLEPADLLLRLFGIELERYTEQRGHHARDN